MGMMSDNRNYGISNKIYEILNQIKGFDVAMGNPADGKILVKYDNIYFELSIKPCYSEEDDKEFKSRPFAEMVRANQFMFK